MTQIWQQIRLGKHVGFEEGESRLCFFMLWSFARDAIADLTVWPLIVGQLDFKPS